MFDKMLNMPMNPIQHLHLPLIFFYIAQNQYCLDPLNCLLVIIGDTGEI